MNVRDQIGFALSIRRWSRAEIDRRVGELAELLGVEQLLGRTIQGLSGGERQRVALGRALAAQPGVLCLDEPLSALDDATREGMYALLKSIRERTHVTTLHITHSRTEAARLGDAVFRLSDGKIHQVSLADLRKSSVTPSADEDAIADRQEIKA
jgi:ABC-type sugar transport system ATPase subunit